MTGIRIAREDEFDKVFSILEASFPADERRTYDAQKALLTHPAYTVYVLPETDGDALKACITVWQFEDFAFVEHFAVAAAYRNQGIGSLMLREIADTLACQLCLEVELPETDLAKRRIEFYKRNGFFVNPYPYIQPAYAADKRPVPLLVMTTGGCISQERFEAIKKTIYKEVYTIKQPEEA